MPAFPRQQPADNASPDHQAALVLALDQVSEFVYMVDENANILYANDAALASLGYTKADLGTLTVFDLTDDFDADSWPAHWREVAAARSANVQTVHRARDGREVPVDIRINYFEHAGRAYHLTLVRDMSEQRRAETLADRVREFVTLAENMPDNIARYGLDGRAIYVNRQLEATLGQPRERLLGTRAIELNPPGVSIFDEYDAGVLRAVHTGEPQTVDLAFQTPDGMQYHQIRMIAERDETGAITGAIALGRDLTERHRHLEQIEQARRDAERHADELAKARDVALEATRIKSEFLANMSHEIRTPMNGVLGLADLLLAGELTESSRELAEGIHRSGVALLTIINDILDFSKLEAGRMTLEEVPFDVHALCRDVVGLVAPRAEQQGLIMRAEVQSDLPACWVGDGGRIRQVLLNLLGNAIKFTTHGEVVLVARTVPGAVPELVFEVRDTGIGIPPERLDAVFESFTQADGSITRRFGGTGLGLSISRQLVELMHGRVGVTSEVGKGSTFTCHLPLPIASNDAQVKAGASLESAQSLAPLGMNVLLVEDNTINQLVAKRLLRGWGCEVTIANDGREGLAQLEKGGFDVVLMHVQKPVMDGLTANTHWRQTEQQRGGHVPVVALTAHAMESDRAKCLELGMDDYVSKPLRPAELHATILRAHAKGERPPGEARAA
jgi:PAS domain S-box-containing protein